MSTNRKVLQARTVVAVAPTTTVLIAPVDVGFADLMALEVINDDGTQTVSAQLERSANGSSPWHVVADDSLALVAAGAVRATTVNVRGSSYVRVTGTASGAGVSARVSATLTGDRPLAI